MPVLRDVPLVLTTEEVLEAQYDRRRRNPPVWLTEAAEQALAIGRPLLAPATVFDEFAVGDVVGERVRLSTGPSSAEGASRGLSVGPKADLLAPAARLLVAVYTIGPALEERVGALQAVGESLLALMLDNVGVVALGALGEQLRQRAEARAAELGWGVSPALSPGSLVGWPVQGQRELCALLPLHEIGVRLNEHCVLVPHKSVSVAIGLGPGYTSHQVGSVCCYCSLADRCWRRRGEQR